ncbi:hypothetical protein R8Z50_25130 [Longispora sp. K20-0274]|uniref:hypothetical protein n=1 Tax=Longispora sp. K20-0274 TaxID=3088255 RepID=UPI00399B9A43
MAVAVSRAVQEAFAADPTAVVNLVGPLGAGKSTLLAGLTARAAQPGDQRPAEPPRGDPRCGAPESGAPESGGPGSSDPGSSDPRSGGAESGGLEATGPRSGHPGPDDPPGQGRTSWPAVDGIDSAGAAAALVGRPGPLIVAGRLPLRSLPGWSDRPDLVTIEVPAWTDDAIDRLAAEHGVTGGPGRAAVRRLAGGVPLIAVWSCRALHAGAPAEVPGAVAAGAVPAILDRLATEGAAPAGALDLLAAVGEADADLLDQLAGPSPGGGRSETWADGTGGLFDVLDRLSPIRRTDLGLAVAEPYRTLLDEAFRWREPVAHRAALTRAAAHVRRLVGDTAEPRRRGSLIFQACFLTGDAAIRDALFPGPGPAAVIRPAVAADFDDIDRLVHQWTVRGSLNPRATGRILDGWLRSTPEGFLMACLPDGRAVGVANVPPVTDVSIASMEPVLQQHTEDVTDSLPGRRGLFVGLAFCDDRQPAIHALLLRAILRPAIQHGAVVVSTMWPEYQQLVRRLGFSYRGATATDVYRCGRPCEVYTQDFTPGYLAGWLDDLARRGVPNPVGHDVARLRRHVRAALESLRDPLALAGNPLLALTGSATPEALRDWLSDAVVGLSAADDRLDAEAGRTLQECYLHPGAVPHDRAAARLHHSRATHFRRLDRGLTILAARLMHARP